MVFLESFGVGFTVFVGDAVIAGTWGAFYYYFAMNGLMDCHNPGNRKYRITNTSTINAIKAKTYLRRDCFLLRGWSASERFFLHLPDFVLSLSFDHLPFLTSGTGKNSPH